MSPAILGIPKQMNPLLLIRGKTGQTLRRHIQRYIASPGILQMPLNQPSHVALRSASQHADFVSHGKQSQIRLRQSRFPLPGLPIDPQCEPCKSEQIAAGCQHIGSGSLLADQYLGAVEWQCGQGAAQSAEPLCFLIQPSAETTGDDGDAATSGHAQRIGKVRGAHPARQGRNSVSRVRRLQLEGQVYLWHHAAPVF
jgi:hypothetical protein